jgi:hypothetical protein
MTTPSPADNRLISRRRFGKQVILLTGLLAVGMPGSMALAQSKAVLQKAVFAKGLAKNQAPVNPCQGFYPTETVNLSLQFKGRPSKGIASAKFYLGNQLITQAQVDVATVNKGIIFSVGSSTFVGFTLSPTKPFPISDQYRVETFFEGKPLATHPFKIMPPANAIPSNITKAVLAKGVDDKRSPVDPATTFPLNKPVYLAVLANLGNGTGVEINWYTNGKLDSQGTKSLTARDNLSNTRFYFSFIPAGGWKPGKQEAVLIMNGHPVGRYSFTTK